MLSISVLTLGLLTVAIMVARVASFTGGGPGKLRPLRARSAAVIARWRRR